jgi:hypothetical protein
VPDFTMPATVTLIRSAAPARFDPAIELLELELKAKLA